MRLARAWWLVALGALVTAMLARGAATAADADGTKAVAAASSGAADVPGEAQRRARLESFNPAMPEAPRASGPVAADPQTEQAYQQALRAYYAYRAQGYEHRRQVFAWQSWSSKAIFFVVLMLVFAGIVFAALQFRAGLRHPKAAQEAATEFVVDLKGIQVRSPVLGVVVLAISLAFFYLYLVYVYPIVDVF